MHTHTYVAWLLIFFAMCFFYVKLKKTKRLVLVPLYFSIFIFLGSICFLGTIVLFYVTFT